MEKRLLALTMGLLLIGVNLFAADGDLIVNGNMGVGTSPGDSVHISRNSTSVSFGTLPGLMVANPSTSTNSFSAMRTTANNGVISGGFFSDGLGTGSTLGRQGVFFGSFTNHPIGLGTNGAEDITINTSGYVGIGTTSPGSYKLNVAGLAYCQLGQWSGSDIRWKKNVEPIGNALSVVQGLQGVKFDWNIEELGKGLNMARSTFDTSNNTGLKSSSQRTAPPDTNGKQIGLVAQDVERVLPEVVRTDSQGYKAVSYEKLTAVLIEAIKELKAEIDNLKAR